MGEWLAYKIAWLLPRRVVYYALIRAWAHATTGRWGTDDATDISCDDVVVRWRLPR
jgi:hypothetical protein